MEQATRSDMPAQRTSQPFSSGDVSGGEQMRPADDFLTYLREYARQKPEVAALWCFGIGFVLGWKLKPW